MEYQEIKDYLDNLIRVYKESRAAESFNSEIKAITVSYKEMIHIHKGIDILADVMGIPLEVEERDDAEFRFEYSFKYRDFLFFQIEKTDHLIRN